MGIESKTVKKKILTAEFYLLIFFIALLLLLVIIAGEFFSLNNVMNILNSASYLLIGAIGMNLIILTGNIDVSAGAIASVVAIFIAFVGKTGAPLYILLPVAMLVGATLSLINALFITWLKIPSMVATLATTQLFSGMLPLIVEGSVYGLPNSFTWLAFKAKIFNVIPASVLGAIVLAIIAIIFMKYSKFSKKIYAIGNDRSAASILGLHVGKIELSVFIIAGALYGVMATILATAGQRVTTTMGSGLEMTMIAAVVLGGTRISGGSGKILGTVLGVLILSIITPAMNYLGLSPDWSDTVMGAIILLSVIVGAISLVKKRHNMFDLKDKLSRENKV